MAQAAPPTTAAERASRRGSFDIITCPPLSITRIGAVLFSKMGLRACALTGRSRALRRRVPRLFVHLASADQRPARRLDGHQEQGGDAVLRRHGDARVG